VAPNTTWSPFHDKPVNDIVSNSDDGPASVIDAARYAFSAQSGTALEDMSSGTTQLIAPGTDKDNSVLAPIGFLFRYDGAFFTDFGVNGNGIVRLGGITSGAAFNRIDSAETPRR